MNEETKTLLQERDRLIEERNKAAARRDPLRHAVTRCDNRIRDLTSSERKRRTHPLCNMGGAICALSPQADASSMPSMPAGRRQTPDTRAIVRYGGML